MSVSVGKIVNVPQQKIVYEIGGAVGIGNTTPVGRLDVAASGTVVPIIANTTGSADLLRLQKSGTNRLTVANNGALTSLQYLTGRQLVATHGQNTNKVLAFNFSISGGGFGQGVMDYSGQQNTTYADPTSQALNLDSNITITGTIGTSKTNPRTVSIPSGTLTLNNGALCYWWDDLTTEANVLAVEVAYDDSFRLSVNGHTIGSSDQTNRNRLFLIPVGRYVSFELITMNTATGNSGCTIKYWKMYSGAVASVFGE